jgi:hypothetical protein
MKPEDFIGKGGTPLPEWKDLPYGFISVEVLGFLVDRPWDVIALAYVSGLNPTSIRVVPHDSAMFCDASTGRVTVILRPDGSIRSIHQEQRVWLPKGVAHGQALDLALEHGIDSEQVKWHDDENIEGYVLAGGYFKRSGGKLVPFPGQEAKEPTITMTIMKYEVWMTQGQGGGKVAEFDTLAEAEAHVKEHEGEGSFGIKFDGRWL